MGGLRFGDVHGKPTDCKPCNKSKTLLCPHWELKPRWRIWFAWLLRLLGWDGDPS